MAFDGIPLAAFDFYEALESDNSKTFWTANKHVYDTAVRGPMTELVAVLEPEFGTAKLFRPYRDVRFSQDKSPYKTSQGAWFEESRRYLQISAAGLMIGGGAWQTSSEQVHRLRQAIDNDHSGVELDKTVTKLRRAGWDLNGERVTRVPTGYPKDHPRVELLKHKSMTASRDLGAPDWLATSQAAAEVRKQLRAVKPLVEWLDRHLG